jgi:chaperonin GroES
MAKKSKAISKSKKTIAKSKTKAVAKKPSKLAAKMAAQKSAVRAAKKSAKAPAAAKASTAQSKAPVKLHLVKPRKLQTQDLSEVFAPLDDRVVISASASAERTPGGLFIPDTVAKEERHLQGQVIAVGRGRRDKKGRLQPLDVQTGDIVLYTPYSGSELKVNGMELVILRETDILGVIA